MPNCRACGCRIGCDSFNGHWIRETNEFVCDGCYDQSCDEDINDDYEQTDKTAPCTDIGETE